jgi:hypothetical protein
VSFSSNRFGEKLQNFRKSIFWIVGLMLCVSSARAATTDEEMCRNGLFPSLLRNVRLAVFTGEAESRLYFFGDMDGCPSLGTNCQSKNYVVPGDELIVGKQHGEWSCVWYSGKLHETVGWVLNHQLKFVENNGRPNWIGKWKQYAYPGYISIARKADRYYVLGNTKWSGAKLADGTRVEHFGDLGGELKVETHLAYSGAAALHTEVKYTCGAEYARVGRYLIVHDNSYCGGMNVRFDGVYTAASRRQ